MDSFALVVTLRSIRRSYVLGLGLIALLVLIGGGFLQLIVTTQERNVNVVNISGRQRMLSQRSALYALSMTVGTVESRRAARRELRAATALMWRSHQGLILGDRELGLSGRLSKVAQALYFAPPTNIDQQVRTFLEHANDLLSVPDEQLDGSNPHLAAILTAAGPLLVAQDMATRQFSLENAQEVDHLRGVQWGIVALTLVTLALETVFIFRPLESEVRQRTLELLQAHDATIDGWSRALDLRDKETEGHSLRVTEMTLRLARLAGMKDDELMHVRRGAMLHDIGKVGIPDAILLKPDKLSPEEWTIMKRHPSYACALLEPIEFLKPALDIPRYHHERWDGQGYPHGLAGEAIPFAARLFAVVDIWDALRSDRPYRPGWPVERVREHIASLAGNHLDPEVVRLFLNNEQRVIANLYPADYNPEARTTLLE